MRRKILTTLLALAVFVGGAMGITACFSDDTSGNGGVSDIPADVGGGDGVITHTHNTVAHEKVEPTCTSSGLEAYYSCDGCDKIFSDELAAVEIEDRNTIIIPALNHAWGDWTVSKAATCTEGGELVCVCANDSTHVLTRETIATGHNISDWIVESVVSCEVDGVRYKECTNCHEVFDKEVTPAIGHNWGEWQQISISTCTEKGQVSRVCANDESHVDSHEVAALGHKLTDWIVDSNATCETSGSRHKNCTVCNEIVVEEVLVAYGHHWGEWTQTVAPTCTEVGTEVSVCAHDSSHTQSREVAALGHKSSDWIIIEDATCTKAGSRKKVCTVCEEELEREAIAALGHSLDEGEIIQQPTCTEVGYTKYTCTRDNCDETKTEEIAALGHKLTEHKEVAATCLKGGVKQYYSCDTCGLLFSDVKAENQVEEAWLAVEALGHDIIKHEEVKATCLTEGLKQYYECTRCKKIFNDEEGKDEIADATTLKINALGHAWGDWQIVEAATCTEGGSIKTVCKNNPEHVINESTKSLGHAWDNGKITKQPTCTEEGEMTYTCTRDNCGESKTEAITALNHEWGDWKVTKQPTCTEKGEEERICANDEEHIEKRDVNALGHDWDNGEVTKAATCTEKGEKTYTCTRDNCGVTYTEDIAELGHEWSEYAVTKQPTCTQKGEEERVCANDEEHVEKRDVDPLDHSWDEGVVTTAATCTQTGEKTFTCTRDNCGETKTEEIEIDSTAHSLNYVEEVAATCTVGGTKAYYICQRCQKYFSAEDKTEVTAESLKINALGHAWDDGVVTTAATCTQTGVKTFTCTRGCGETRTDTIALLGHSMTYHAEEAATCEGRGTKAYYSCSNCQKFFTDKDGENEVTEDDLVIDATNHTLSLNEKQEPTCEGAGKEAYYSCANCDKLFSDENGENEVSEDSLAIEATGHSYGNWTVTTPPACEQKGEETRICAYNPEHKETKEVAALEHVYLLHAEEAATCTTSGTKAYYSCENNCQKYFSAEDKTEVSKESLVIEEIGHDPKEQAQADASCTATGRKAYYICANCNKSYFNEACTQEITSENIGNLTIVMTDHTQSDWIIATQATCEREGSKYTKCTVCGQKLKEETTEKTGHKYEDVEKVEPTCNEVGYTLQRCTNCGTQQKVNEVAAIDHVFIEDEEKSTPATCLNDGTTVYKCKNCDESYTKSVAKLEHDYVQFIETVDATCTENGYTVYKCKNGCEQTNNKFEENSALGHSFTVVESKDATCTEEGYTTNECVRCGKTNKTIIEATGHQIVNATCTTAGYCENDCGWKTPATGHSFVKTGEVYAATCEADGYTVYKCAYCDETENRDITTKLGHTVTDWGDGVETQVEGKACTYYLVYTKKCDKCQEVQTKYGTQYTSHSYTAVLSKAAKCNENGTYTYTCSKCNDSYETEYSDENNHAWDDGVTVGNIITYTCTRCGEKKTAVANISGTEAQVSASDLKQADELALENAVIKLDDAAKNELLTNETAEVKLAATSLTQEEAQEALGGIDKDINADAIYNITLQINGEQQSQLGGKATVRIPYDLGYDEDPNDITVGYLYTDENGDNAIELIKAKYVEENGKGYAEFETEHFSYYTVTRLTPAERCELYGHDNVTSRVAATCFAEGYTINTCQRCGNIEKLKSQEKLEHVTEKEEKAATCTADGYTKEICKVCKSVIKSQVIKATGHDYKEIENTQATCYSQGKIVSTCNACGNTKVEIIKVSDHNYNKVVTDPTCVAYGYTTYTCQNEDCGSTYVSDYNKPSGHNMQEEVVAPTCVSKGYSYKYCTVCNTQSEKYDETDVLEHSWNVEDADCVTKKYCKNCGYLAASALGHNMSNGSCTRCGEGCVHNYQTVKTVAATCSRLEYRIDECTICYYRTEVENKDSQLLEHSYTTINTVAATCVSQAYYVKECSLCRDISNEYFGELAEHVFIGGVCINCGKTSSEYYYQLIASIFDLDSAVITLDNCSVIYETQKDDGSYGVYGTFTIDNISGLELGIDENGAIFATAKGEATIYNGPAAGSFATYTIKASLGDDGIVYIHVVYDIYEQSTINANLSDLDIISSDEYDMAITLDYLLTSATNNSINSNLVANIYAFASNNILPQLKALLQGDSSRVNEYAEKLLAIAFTRESTSSGYKLVLDYDKISQFNSDLYKLNVNEVVDKYLGEGTFDKLSTVATELMDLKLGEVIPYIKDNLSIDTDIVCELVNTVASFASGQDFDIQAMLESENYSSAVLGTLMFGNENYASSLSDMIAMLSKNSLYQLAFNTNASSTYENVNSVISYVKQLVSLSIDTTSSGTISGINIGISGLTIAPSGSMKYTVNGNVLVDVSGENHVEVNTDDVKEITVDINQASSISDISLDIAPTNGFYEELEIDGNVYSTYYSYMVLRKIEYGNDDCWAVTVSSDCDGWKVVNGYYKYYSYTAPFNYYVVLDEKGNFTSNYIFYSTKLEAYAYITLNESLSDSEQTVFICEYNGNVQTITVKNGDYSFIETIFGTGMWSIDYTSNVFKQFLYNPVEDEYDYSNSTHHNYVLDEAQSHEPTVCGEEGYRVYVCSNCGSTKTNYYTLSHTTVYAYRLADGATNCEEGVEWGEYCIKCGEFEVFYTFYNHNTIYQYVLKGNSLSVTSSCVCGQTSSSRGSINIQLDMPYELVTVSGLVLEDGYLKITPEQSATYEIYTKNGYIEIFDENRNYIGKDNKTENDCYGYIVELEAGKVYYIRINNSGSTLYSAIHTSNVVELENVVAECGGNVTITVSSLFGTLNYEVGHNHIGDGKECYVNYKPDTEEVDGKYCQKTYTQYLIFTDVNGEEYRYEVGSYTVQNDHASSYSTTVDDEPETTVDKDGNTITITKKHKDYLCGNCGIVIRRYVYYTYYDADEFNYYSETFYYELNANNELYMSQLSAYYKEVISGSNVPQKTIETYYDENGNVIGTTTYIYEYTNNVCEGTKTTIINGDEGSAVTTILNNHKYTNNSDRQTTTIEIDGIVYNTEIFTLSNECRYCHTVDSKTEYYTVYNQNKDVIYSIIKRYSDGSASPYYVETAYFGYDNGVQYTIKRAVDVYQDGELVADNSYVDEYEYTGKAYCAYEIYRVQNGERKLYDSGVNHYLTDYEYILKEGSETCEDGLIRIDVCSLCGEIISEEEVYGHYTNRYKVDMAQYGSDCGGYIQIESCPCGERVGWPNIYIDCDFERKIEWVKDSDGKYNHNIEIYSCAVTDPEVCGFTYTVEEWYEYGEECAITWHYVYTFGADANNCYVYEKENKGGESHSYQQTEGEESKTTEGEYTVYTNTYSETCSRCGRHLSEVIDVQYYLKDELVKREYTQKNFNEDGTLGYINYSTEIVSYSPDGDSNWYTSYYKNEYYEDNEITSYYDEWTNEYKWIQLEEGGSYYFLRTSEKFSNSDGYWYSYTYEYDGCQYKYVRTYVNSEGYKEVYNYDHDNDWGYYVKTFGTCTQYESYCAICGKVVDKSVTTSHKFKYNELLEVYVCSVCGMESETGVNGSITLEDLTSNEKFGKDGYYTVGYHFNKDIDYSIKVIMVYGDEDIVTEINAEDDGKSLIRVSIQDVLDRYNNALKEGKITNQTAIGVRVTIVADGDNKFDYSVTCDFVCNSATGHSYNLIEGPEELTCGYNEYVYSCDVCGIIITKKEYTEHIAGETQYVLKGQSCEDGLVIMEVCSRCGETISEEEVYYHYLISTIVDMAEYGSECGGYFIYQVCPCGENDWGVNMRFNCNFESQTTRLEDSDDIYDHELYTYICIKDECGFKYTVERWYELDEECTITNYYNYTFGADEDNCYVFERVANGGEGHNLKQTDVIESKKNVDEYTVSSYTYSYVCTRCRRILQIVTDETYYSGDKYVKNEYTVMYYNNDGTYSYAFRRTQLKSYSPYTDNSSIYTSSERYDYYTDNVITRYNVCNYGYSWIKIDNGSYVLLNTFKEYRDSDGYWYTNTYKYDGCQYKYVRTYADSNGKSDVYEYDHNNIWYYYTNTFGTCTQYVTLCNYCGQPIEKFRTTNHEFLYNQVLDAYVCGFCGLESETGENDYNTLENLTSNETFGKDGYYTIGYHFNCGYEEYSVNVILVVDGNDIVTDIKAEDDGKSLLRINIQDVLDIYNKAIEEGTITTTSQVAVKIAIVVDGGSQFDFALTCDFVCNSATGHSYNLIQGPEELTCGYNEYTYSCDVCGIIITKSEYIEHVYVANQYALNGQSCEDGVVAYNYCVRCGKTQLRYENASHYTVVKDLALNDDVITYTQSCLCGEYVDDFNYTISVNLPYEYTLIDAQNLSSVVLKFTLEDTKKLQIFGDLTIAIYDENGQQIGIRKGYDNINKNGYIVDLVAGQTYYITLSAAGINTTVDYCEYNVIESYNLSDYVTSCGGTVDKVLVFGAVEDYIVNANCANNVYNEYWWGLDNWCEDCGFYYGLEEYYVDINCQYTHISILHLRNAITGEDNTYFTTEIVLRTAHLGNDETYSDQTYLDDGTMVETWTVISTCGRCGQVYSKSICDTYYVDDIITKSISHYYELSETTKELYLAVEDEYVYGLVQTDSDETLWNTTQSTYTSYNQDGDVLTVKVSTYSYTLPCTIVVTTVADGDQSTESQRTMYAHTISGSYDSTFGQAVYNDISCRYEQSSNIDKCIYCGIIMYKHITTIYYDENDIQIASITENSSYDSEGQLNSRNVTTTSYGVASYVENDQTCYYNYILSSTMQYYNSSNELTDYYGYRYEYNQGNYCHYDKYYYNSNGDKWLEESGENYIAIEEISFRNENQTNCEDGIIVTRKCASCGITFDVINMNEHYTICRPISLAQYGCKDDSVLNIYACLCGRETIVNVFGGCNFELEDNAIDGDDTISEHYIITYTCINQECGFVYTHEFYKETTADGVVIDHNIYTFGQGDNAYTYKYAINYGVTNAGDGGMGGGDMGDGGMGDGGMGGGEMGGGEMGGGEMAVIVNYEVYVFLDDSGAPATDAIVTIGGTSAVTNEDGLAIFYDMIMDNYPVSIIKDGYIFVETLETADQTCFKVFLEKNDMGDVQNPYIVYELGLENSNKVENAVYYKYTVYNQGQYTVALNGGKKVVVYKNVDVTASSSSWKSVSSITSSTKKGVFEFAECDEVYFCVYPDDDGFISFVIKEYDEETDAGYSQATAIDLTDRQYVALNDVAKTMYFNYTSSQHGRLTITVTDVSGNAVTFKDIYNKVDGVAPVKTASTIYFGNSSNIQVSSASIVLDSGVTQTIKIALNSLSNAIQYNVQVEFMPIVAVDHNISVTDGEVAVADLVVLAMNGSEEVARGITDENGVATLNMIPGVYSLQFENLSDDYYYGSVVKTELPSDGSKDFGSDYKIVLEKTTAHTITVNLEGTAIEGLTVTVKNAKGTKVAEGTTDESGNVTLKFVAGENTISASGYSTSDYYCDNVITSADETDYTLDILAKVQYKVNVSIEDGAELTGKIYVKLQYGVSVSQTASAVVDENGVATFETKYKPGVYAITINDSYVPEGYYFEAVSTTAESDTVNVVLRKKVTYAITVMNGEDVVEGATVTLGDGTSAMTDESGVATLVAILENVIVSVSLPESLAEDYYAPYLYLEEGVTTFTVHVLEKVVYTVIVLDEEDARMANAVVTLTGSDGNTYSATTDENGIASVKVIPFIEYTVSIKLKGYKGTATITQGATDCILIAEVQAPDPMIGTHSYTSSASGCSITVQVDGTYLLTFSGENKVYVKVNTKTTTVTGTSYKVTLKEGDVLSVWGVGGTSGEFVIEEV